MNEQLTEKNCLDSVPDYYPTHAVLRGTPTPTPVPRVIEASSDVAHSAELDKLAVALSKAQGAMETASKDSKNPHFNSKYADLANVWEACRTVLSENGLSVVQMPAAEGNKVTVTTLLLHTSGQWIRSKLTMVTEKSTPQGIGSCITYARRYALSSVVGIAPEDDDGNAASGAGGGPAKPVATKTPAAGWGGPKK